MIIGLTYDLRQDYLAEGYSMEETAEFDKPETVEGIEAALQELGHSTGRIGNGKKLVGRLATGDRWDMVFNFAEGWHGVAREAQVPAILDLYRIPYTFSDPLVLALALHKEMTKTRRPPGGRADGSVRLGPPHRGPRKRRSAFPAFRQARGRRDEQGDHCRFEEIGTVKG